MNLECGNHSSHYHQLYCIIAFGMCVPTSMYTIFLVIFLTCDSPFKSKLMELWYVHSFRIAAVSCCTFAL